MQRFLLAFLALLCAHATGRAHGAERLIPASVLLYETHQAEFPPSNFDLSLCRLLARNPGGKFFALPGDRGAETCDLTGVHLAYGGWCASGVLDATGGVHFSQPLLPLIEVVRYADGVVVYANHYLKTFAAPTDRDELAALTFLQTLPHAPYDVRGVHFPLFPPGWDSGLPLKASQP